MSQSTLKPLQITKKIPFENKKPIAAPPKPVRLPSHDEIADRARALWQSKGCPAGCDEQIWLEAEAQLKNGKA